MWRDSTGLSPPETRSIHQSLSTMANRRIPFQPAFSRSFFISASSAAFFIFASGNVADAATAPFICSCSFAYAA